MHSSSSQFPLPFSFSTDKIAMCLNAFLRLNHPQSFQLAGRAWVADGGLSGAPHSWPLTLIRECRLECQLIKINCFHVQSIPTLIILSDVNCTGLHKKAFLKLREYGVKDLRCLLPAVGKQNATYSSKFTQPGKSLVVQPSTINMHMGNYKAWLRGGPQVAWMLQAKPGRSGKLEQ